MTLRIEALARSHNSLLSKFENQHPSLTEYVRRYALRHQEKDRLAKTFLAIHWVGSEQAAARFYEHNGFNRLEPEAPCRLVLDLAPLTNR